jgi:hypothetical protein
MLLRFTKKLCPLMSLMALSFGCGKKINDPETTGSNQGQQNQTPSSVVVLEIKTSSSYNAFYKIPIPGWFYFPSNLTLKKGSALGKRVKITYNVDQYGHDQSCYYGSAVDSKEIPFENCVNDNGDVTVPSASHLSAPFVQSEGKQIEMELLNGAASDDIIDAVYTVDWVD